MTTHHLLWWLWVLRWKSENGVPPHMLRPACRRGPAVASRDNHCNQYPGSTDLRTIAIQQLARHSRMWFLGRIPRCRGWIDTWNKSVRWEHKCMGKPDHPHQGCQAYQIIFISSCVSHWYSSIIWIWNNYNGLKKLSLAPGLFHSWILANCPKWNAVSGIGSLTPSKDLPCPM